MKRGVATIQQLDDCRPRWRLPATGSHPSRPAFVLVKQEAEGAVIVPVEGRVLSVPVTRGAVIMGGEAVCHDRRRRVLPARLSIPKGTRDAQGGAPLRISTAGGETNGRLAKIYPQIEIRPRNQHDVEVENRDTAYVDARILVQVPSARARRWWFRDSAVTTRSGLDFVTIEQRPAMVERAVVTGTGAGGRRRRHNRNPDRVSAGDRVVVK